ncbi:hypothetical protein BDA99DRAFT_533394 [Phascolomyces articulosus]|uniref:Ubiquitin-like protease family profile domain-containing protein n=1 Tax=Phascolomyces articulosus TaxID=60185 RepID=A0AAD5K8X9_9FUNG|nr:hypothetical protein BDA99DRAFT_533394 [Phascolomyces articulosus]
MSTMSLNALAVAWDIRSNIPNELRSSNVIFFPVNNSHPGGGTHWSLLVFLRSANSFFYYDSSPWMNENIAKKIMKRITPFLGIPPRTRKVQMIRMNGPIQKNGYSCGVFVIISTSLLIDRFRKGFDMVADTMHVEKSFTMYFLVYFYAPMDQIIVKITRVERLVLIVDMYHLHHFEVIDIDCRHVEF